MQCTHVLKKLKERIKGTLLHSERSKGLFFGPLDLHNALMHSSKQRGCTRALRRDEGTCPQAFIPSRCTHALKGKEGTLTYAKRKKENHSSLRGVLMFSREGMVLHEEGVCSRGKLGHSGHSFQFLSSFKLQECTLPEESSRTNLTARFHDKNEKKDL